MLIGIPLCLALGVALGFAVSGNNPESSIGPGPTTSTTARVLGAQVTQPPTTATTARTFTLPTLRPQDVTTTTAKAATPTTTRRATTATTRPATTRTTAPARATCGTGAWNASAQQATSSNGSSFTNTISATVKSTDATKAIEIDSLSVRVKYADGSTAEVVLSDAKGQRVDPGEPGRTFTAQNTSSSQPTTLEVQTFSFHVAGQPDCKSA
jgi:hypothetical protein